MKQGTEWDGPDFVINEKYYPASIDTSPTFSCNDTFTVLQTAVNAEISYFAARVELTPMTSSYPLLARYSYLDIPSAPVTPTFQIVCLSSEAANLCSMKPGSRIMFQLEVALSRRPSVRLSVN